jgi:hypothetical protein
MKYLMILFLAVPFLSKSQDLFQVPEDAETRWISFENPTGAKGAAATANKGSKGRPFGTIKPGESVTLFDVKGAGIIKRIWMTIDKRDPKMLRSLRLDMYWNGESKPAVSVPFGDFFGVGIGKRVPFQSVFFSDPEGRSFNCVIPMPFKTGGKIVLTNENDRKVTLFYEIDMLKVNKLPEGANYFHAHWNRNNRTRLGEDFEILPKVNGKGRFLGSNMGVITDSSYENTWFGEGEVKIWLDGDGALPSLASTGTEDYIGSGWGQGVYGNMYQGCLVANKEKGEFAFYRYHVPDPIYFRKDCRVVIQQMGGDGLGSVRGKYEAGAKMIPVSITGVDYNYHINVFDESKTPTITDPKFPEGWVNFYRLDNFSATAYFYLDKPVSNLPALAPLKERLEGIE